MKDNGLNAIRKAFLDFYVSKEHYPAKSASLIPKDDKSLLIINSGMAPLKKYFAGLETPPAKRMTTCQKCVRTGDIENVGKTSRHGTFFEMLGNFSFGDYFKEQSLNWGWEFITKVLELPTDKLWATVYLDDDQAYDIWKNIGMPEDRIVRLGKDDNFWEIGLGPCGPCSEIYYDRGPEFGCDNPDCKPGCDCDRYVEFWNHVFTQFSKEEDGSYSDLEHPNIDTGMGLERIACIMQGVDSIFDIDTIRYILDGVLEVSGAKYEEDGTQETDISIRIVTDHLRSMVFMIADGINPSNEGRGYVLRRLIRRAARHGKLLGIEGEFLSKLADRVIHVSGEAYPELVEKQELIKKVISIEEERFSQTLDQGIEIIGSYMDEMEQSGTRTLSGDKAFKLYDTYGFPLEVTQEILEEKGYDLDMDGFNKAMEEQKTKAREGRHVTDDAAWDTNFIEGLPETVFTGYENVVSVGEIIALRSESGNSDVINTGEEGIIFLDKTPFYAESGGQVYDTGFMYTDTAEALVENVTKAHGVFAHKVKVTADKLSVGDEVRSEIHTIRRNLVARNHTATHLLHAALREVVGEHVHQAGSLVSESGLRFDYTHFEPLTMDQIQAIEALVNEKINEFIPVSVTETSMAEAQKMGAMALFDEKYGDNVRVVGAGNFSIELCGGTHVNNTGEIGAFHLVSETGIASGVRRIEAVTAQGLREMTASNDILIDKLSETLKCKPDNLLARVQKLSEEHRSQQKELDKMRKEEMGSGIESMLQDAKEVNGIKLITKKFDGVSIDDLRNLSDDIKKDNKDVVMVFANVNEDKVVFLVSITDELVEKGLHAGNIVKEVAKTCGGGGGGKANMAQAGAKDISKIQEAFAVAESLLK